MVRYSLFFLAACTGGFQFHSSTSGSTTTTSSSTPSGGGGGGDADSDDDGKALVATPHGSGPKFVALLAKLDDPKPQKNFEYQDASDRWPYYRKSLGDPWTDFKKEMGIAAGAPATIDGDSFEADWYQQLKKDPGATLTGPDYWCSKPFDASAITLGVKSVLQQSKQCVAAFKSVKAFRCVDDPKQDGLANFEMTKDGEVIFHVHDPHVADSSQDFGAMLTGWAKVLPPCQKIVDKTLGN